jgi:hypothetical protein
MSVDSVDCIRIAIGTTVDVSLEDQLKNPENGA